MVEKDNISNENYKEFTKRLITLIKESGIIFKKYEFENIKEFDKKLNEANYENLDDAKTNEFKKIKQIFNGGNKNPKEIFLILKSLYEFSDDRKNFMKIAATIGALLLLPTGELNAKSLGKLKKKIKIDIGYKGNNKIIGKLNVKEYTNNLYKFEYDVERNFIKSDVNKYIKVNPENKSLSEIIILKGRGVVKEEHLKFFYTYKEFKNFVSTLKKEFTGLDNISKVDQNNSIYIVDLINYELIGSYQKKNGVVMYTLEIFILFSEFFKNNHNFHFYKPGNTRGVSGETEFSAIGEKRGEFITFNGKNALTLKNKKLQSINSNYFFKK